MDPQFIKKEIEDGGFYGPSVYNVAAQFSFLSPRFYASCIIYQNLDPFFKQFS